MTSLIPVQIALAYPIPQLTYLAPSGMAPGVRVRIQLRNKIVSGIVLGTIDNPPHIDLKQISTIIDPFPLLPINLWKLLMFACNYYGCSIADLFPLCIPWALVTNWETVYNSDGYCLSHLRDTNNWSKLTKLGLDWHSGILLLPTLFYKPTLKGFGKIEVHLTQIKNTKKLTAAQLRVIQTLKNNSGVALEDFLQHTAQAGRSVITKLEHYGLLKRTRRIELLPQQRQFTNYKHIELSHEQKHAISSIKPNEFNVYLLYGITGSGKTEVYIELTKRTLAIGKRVLWLVPEIGLTPSLLACLEARFPGQVASGHAGLKTSEKQANIIKLLKNQAPIFVGVRNAVIAPVQNLGLIIVDEEHESSYKSDEYPYINARDLAIKRAQLELCPIVLGSATPSLESWHATQQKRYHLLRLTERPTGAQLPIVQVVDLRECYKVEHKKTLFSPPLLKAIQDNLALGEQSMLLLNRRGFENFWMCRACGKIIFCPHCSLSLTYHKHASRLRCHMCGFESITPKTCISCNSEHLRGVGEGTEQVEHSLKQLFPAAKILRLDRDTTSKRGSLESNLLAAEKGDFNILVGTQMLAKGHNFPLLTLVGILNADQGLRTADFRAGEKTFQLLTQVAGRAGRAAITGRVILQTYSPHHPAIIHAVNQNFEEFANEELPYRKLLGYPPYAFMVLYRSNGNTPTEAAEPLLRLRSHLKHFLDLRILGPLEAPVAKTKNRYRMFLIVRTSNRQQLNNAIASIDLGQYRSIITDRDPLNFNT